MPNASSNAPWAAWSAWFSANVCPPVKPPPWIRDEPSRDLLMRWLIE
ncbi:hypothetical protein IC611_12215 [Proteus mirabilis]